MAPSRWETYRLYGYALYVLGISVPLKAVQWLVRGPRPLSWSLRTTLYVHLMKMFAAKEGLGWQPALPPVAPLADVQGPAPVSFVGQEDPSPAPPAIGDDGQKARESAPKIDDKNYVTTGVTIPLEPHKAILGEPIFPYTHTYAHPNTGARTTTTVEPKAVRGYWIEWADGLRGDRTKGEGEVIFAMHGGGYVGGWPTFPNFYRLSRRGGFPVFSVKYRLGTKHSSRWPAPIQDAAIAYSYLLHDCGYDPGSITFMGDSAGGNLASVLMLYLVLRGLPLPGKLILLSPWADLTASHPSANDSPIDYLLPAGLQWAGKRFVRGDESLLTTALVSPDHADWTAVGQRLRKDGRRWPDTFITWGELEVFADEAASLARKMRQDAGFGDRIKDLSFKDMIHDLTFLPVAEGTSLRSLIVDFVLDRWQEDKADRHRAVGPRPKL